MNDLISIVVPVYGVEKYISECIVSIANQTYRNFELLIINDGSKDNSIDVCLDTLRMYPDIEAKVINKQNGGLSSARNVGIKSAKGEYICFVDSDDSIQPHYLEVLYRGIKQFEADISIASFQMIAPGGEARVHKNNDIYKCYNRVEMQNCFLYRQIKPAPVCFMCKTNFLRNNTLLFDEKVFFSEDQVFFWRLFDAINKAVYSDTIIYNYYIRENSISTHPSIDIILSGYSKIIENSKSLVLNEKCIYYMTSRWVFGTLHNTAKYCDMSFFKRLCCSLDYRKHMKTLFAFDDQRVRVCSRICYYSAVIGYLIFRLR